MRQFRLNINWNLTDKKGQNFSYCLQISSLISWLYGTSKLQETHISSSYVLSQQLRSWLQTHTGSTKSLAVILIWAVDPSCWRQFKFRWQVSTPFFIHSSIFLLDTMLNAPVLFKRKRLFFCKQRGRNYKFLYQEFVVILFLFI